MPCLWSTQNSEGGGGGLNFSFDNVYYIPVSKVPCDFNRLSVSSGKTESRQELLILGLRELMFLASGFGQMGLEIAFLSDTQRPGFWFKP